MMTVLTGRFSVKQLLAVHREGAVAVDVDHQLARVRGLHPHRGGQPVAHGAEPARGAPPPRVLEAVVLGGPHLVLTHPGDHVGLALGQVRQLLDDVLRLDHIVVPVVAQREVALPVRDLRGPLPPAFGHRGGHPVLQLLPHRLDQAAQHALAVADDRDVDLDVLGDRRGIDVDVDDLRVRREGVHPPGHPVVEARGHRHQAVGVVHRHVGVVGAVHAEHVERERIGHRKRAQAHEGLGERDLGQVRQLPQLGRGVRGDRAPAHVEHRPLGPHHRAGRLLDLPGMALVGRIVRAQVHTLRVLEGPLLDQDVLRQVHVDRPRAPGGGDVKRLLDDRGQVLAVLDQEVVLGGRASDADVVGLLERVVADRGGGHLPGEGHDRNRVHQGVLERGDQVGRGRPGGDEADADPAGCPRVPFRRVPGGGLLADQDVAQALEVVQGVVDRQDRAAR